MNLIVKEMLPKKTVGFFKRVLSAYRLVFSRCFGLCRDYYPLDGKIKVLFYEFAGMSYGGSQKSLQILAKHLDSSKFDVYYTYSEIRDTSRLHYFKNSSVKLVPFSHGNVRKTFPYFIENMQPHIFDIIRRKKINLIIYPSSGYPEYPIANITKVPIIQVNVFGSINVQKNIKKILCVSEYITRIVKSALTNKDVTTLYNFTEGPDPEANQRGLELRKSLGLSSGNFVFGRIGRPDDNIFDPIGLLAFKEVVKIEKQAHYIIMAPAQAAVDMVKKYSIPNVHFLPPNGNEASVWAFHNAIDVLAHFRCDGETMGLNIAESMICGKPVITHVSKFWNAHLEYLDDSFSRIASVDDDKMYAKHMLEFLRMNKIELENMGMQAKQKAQSLFSIKSNIQKFEKIIFETLK